VSYKTELEQSWKDARYEWCKAREHWTVHDWRRLLPSDETKVQKGHKRGRTRCTRTKREEKIPVAFVPKGKQFAEHQFWGTISWHDGVGPCYHERAETKEEREESFRKLEAINKEQEPVNREIFDGAMSLMSFCRDGKPAKSRKREFRNIELTRKNDRGGIDWYYHQTRILDPLYIPFCKEQLAKYGNILILEDGAAPHTAKVQDAIWIQHGLQEYRLSWPSHSPDLNPIEKIWSFTKQYIDYTEDTDELIRMWKEAWKSVPLGLVRKLMDKMRWKVHKVIKLHGDNKYVE
jgi:transposase